eukprot:SAG11_NODE_1102_length_5866_cov_2.173574_3_plen_159_part_00
MVCGCHQEFTLKINAMRAWLQEQRFSKRDQTTVLAYFRELWKSKTLFKETEILGEMPPAMRGELVQRLYKPAVQQMPLFKGLTDEIIAAICFRARPLVAIKGQEIMTEGLPGREMFLLLTGEVEVSTGGLPGRGSKKRLGFLSDGAFFGEAGTGRILW